MFQFPDQNLCTKYIHDLLGVTDSICNDNQKIDAVKQAWLFGHEHGLLTNEMYEFGIDLLKLEDESQEQLVEVQYLLVFHFIELKYLDLIFHK